MNTKTDETSELLARAQKLIHAVNFANTTLKRQLSKKVSLEILEDTLEFLSTRVSMLRSVLDTACIPYHPELRLWEQMQDVIEDEESIKNVDEAWVLIGGLKEMIVDYISTEQEKRGIPFFDSIDEF